ncbi:ABC transporter substrate-binding protein [Roseococcus suduntuyensis]|uniref:Thiamine pyrimidine synthase n=1 Tax=Roseococcus suduntuyensis TaxID=455361 RepID=A0A840A579_9PROT|nr:ABC transporter substrate-binding protein [Roseococcus suduntuyensis]MBB3896669.1 NitT/TauT family transport system substrate-binding protein [Roseococcus suduntuyensis]
MNRRHLLAATGAAAVSPFIRPAGAQTLTRATLRLKWLTQAQFAGFYVALQKGYYREAGIDLTINPGGPNLLTENLVASGADTFGLSGGTDSVFAARERNLPIVCAGVMHQQTPFVFVTRADGPIRTLADFRGKTITTWFTGANFVLLGMLAQAGLSRGDFTMQPQQVSVQPFVDRQVDVVTATRYNEFFTLMNRVGRDNLRSFVPDDHGITFPRDTVIVSEQTARDRPQMVTAFLRATIRGWREALRDGKAGVDAVMSVAPTLNRPHQEFMMEEAGKLMVAGGAARNGLFWIDRPVVQAAHDFFLRHEVIKTPLDLAAAYNSSFLEAIPLADRIA